MRNGPKKGVALYAAVSREQLATVRNAPGGDEGRVAALASMPEVPLVGRPVNSGSTVGELLQDVLRRVFEATPSSAPLKSKRQAMTH